MSLFIECKSDETLAFALGVPRKNIEHALGRASVCAQLSRRTGVTGMVDEDPHTISHPYLLCLKEQRREKNVRILFDEKRKNRVVMLCPRLEEWLVEATKSAGLKLTDFGFENDNGVQLHSEINQRLSSLEKLVKALLDSKSTHLLCLQKLLK
jgi:hypothetical protein